MNYEIDYESCDGECLLRMILSSFLKLGSRFSVDVPIEFTKDEVLGVLLGQLIGPDGDGGGLGVGGEGGQPRRVLHVCSWMCGMWGLGAMLGWTPPGSHPPSQEAQCVVCAWYVWLSVLVEGSLVCGVYKGEGWPSLEFEDIKFVFILSCLACVVYREEGWPSLEFKDIKFV